MTAGPWQLTTTALAKLADGTFDLGHDTWKVALFLSTSNIATSSTTYAGVTNQHAAANGYPTGGDAVTFAFTGTTVVDIAFTANPTFVADGGPITARYGVLYKVGGDVLAFTELDDSHADVTAADGSILQIDSDGTPNPLFSLTSEAGS